MMIYWAYDESTSTLKLGNSAISGTDSGSFDGDEDLGYYTPWDDYLNYITTVTIVNEIAPTNTSGWFACLYYVTTFNGIDNLDTSGVTYMAGMFYECGVTSLDLSSFDTSNVESMYSMFYECGVTSLDLSNFDTSNVFDMERMFCDCESLTSLNLSSFDVSSVTTMARMFYNCGSLETIYANSDWNINAPESTRMFSDCTSLVGAIAYDSTKTGGAYANPTTGYFTAVTTYTVTFNANGHGTAPSPITGVESGETITEPSPAPTATGYTFGGWYKEQGCINAWNFSTDTVTQDTTLWAKWTAISYSITYNLDGGTVATANPTTYTIETASFTLNNPAKTDFTFDGWTGTGLTEETLSVTVPTGSTGNRTYTANYSSIYTAYDVTFHNNGHGYTPPTQTVIESRTATEPTAPTETGYTFGGWFTEQACTNQFSFSTPITDDTDLWAKWTAIPQYTVSFNMMGHGQAISSQTVYSGQTATEPMPPIAEGYEFRGWYDSTLTTEFSFSTPITQNITLYANWHEIPVLNWNGNRHNEDYIFKRVEWSNFQEHEEYDYITKGSIEYSTEADLKVTGSFEFEGYDIPKANDLIRVYYDFTDEQGLTAHEPIGTFFVNYAELKYEDTLKGIKASGTLEGSSVLKLLQDKKVGMPYTVKKNANAVYEADNILKDTGLQTNLEASGFVLSVDKTFDSGTTYLEIVNWLLTTAGYAEAYPDGNGTVQLVSTATIQSRAVKKTFANNEQSIMYPEVDESNDWQETPNVVRLLYNTDDACVAAEAVNVTGSRASLDARGNREKTYFEEISDVGDGSITTLLKELAESTLKEQSCDVEYVTMSHAYVPIQILDLIEIRYADMNWSGLADNISIDLSPATKTQTKIKRTLYEDIVITSSATVYRST